MRVNLHFAIALTLAAHALGCGESGGGGLKVDIRLDQNVRGTLPVRVDVYVVDDCDSVVVGLDPESVIASTFQLDDLTTGPPLSNVTSGDYGLYVIARDADCFVVGAQCDAVTLVEDDGAALSITVPELRGAGCSDDEVCVEGTGECTLVDGAVGDCRDEPDGVPCRTGGDSGQCRAGACCAGCWDGSTCRSGDETVRCGVGGGLCALCECFSDTCEEGQCAPSTAFRDVDMGLDHTCAIDEDGRAWCWGYDNGGQVGTGGATPSTCGAEQCTRPTEMSLQLEGSVPTWTDISAGEQVTCAIRASDSSLWCWGSNEDGRMGVSDSVSSSNVPLLVSRVAHSKVDNQQRGGCAIRDADASLWCWGDNSRGQVGQGSSNGDALGPSQVPYGTTWDDVSVGNQFVLGISEERYWGWGLNNDGQLGTGVTGSTTHPDLTGFVGSAVEAGNGTACGLDMSGVAHCWGENQRGQVGNGESSSEAVVNPTPVSGGHRFDHFALGSAAACAVTTGGALYCWGHNRYDQLGVGQSHGELPQASEPLRLGEDADWAKVTAGGDSACALRENGSLWCWGRNQRGQLGLGDTDTRQVPTRLCF